jgi:16S rRNA (guanine527-N7)-methyltransferase
MPASGLIGDLARVSGRDVPRETLDRLKDYEALLREEATRQNLISASTIDDVWHRHVLDSAQLLKFAPANRLAWADIGSGAGLPGIVLACFSPGPVALIEPRRLRAEFLHRVVGELGLDAEILPLKVERARGTFDVITARAVANLSELLRISAHLSTRNTVWTLPKGRNAEAELVEARKSWHGVFHVEHSVTDPDSRIIVATGVAKK